MQEGIEVAGPSGGSHQGAGQWARRGAERMGLSAGEDGDVDSVPEPPTADDADPDISPSLAGGHTDGTHHDN